MKTAFKVAAIQMVSTTQPQQNLDTAARLVAQAAADGAQLVVLPEYFCLMGREEGDKVRIREPFGDGPIQQQLAAMARDNKVWLVGGTLPLACDDEHKVLNSLLLYAPDGSVHSRYDKIHLFGFTGNGERYCESDSIVAGSQPLRAETPLADIAFGICYDLRFPELFRQMAPFDLLVLPAAFTAQTGEAHWEVLLRARAIENQCYVLASAQGGSHENGRKTHGQSLIIDPWGRIVAQLDKGEGVVIAEIDPEIINSVRTRLPALSHRVFS
ncbi:carbon-nitrogen hydrolase family protein [Vogesella sp. AC12]|uniref:carbon-nitrogen hydrolase family protein n=1 Tax=Vogesella sp. AC12 TaxID=2950550 RepID=UPI00210AADB1|nr:carbon-nitrogen hydrolase family protein [Vogesella sp. AC12]MCQ4145048.1 carbon-nitrogen hydrolase family protein [Vogesella sp. AC12]